MRINRLIAAQTGWSRRSADTAIATGRVTVNGAVAELGQQVAGGDAVRLDGEPLRPVALRTILLHKPVNYVCSRNGQGAPTVYDLLPPELHDLKPVGRLDKDSSGLLVMTNDGQLANQLAHPSAGKTKVYQVKLDQPLQDHDRHCATAAGVKLEDGFSRLGLSGEGADLTVTMTEGRNRQIRRTFAKLGYAVVELHRTSFGPYQLENLPPGQWREA